MCHDICYSDLSVFIELFKITENSLSNNGVELCEPTCVGASKSILNRRKQTVVLTLDQLFVGLWCCLFLPSKDSNLPSVHLTTPHFNTPRGAQVGASTFVISTMWPLGMKMKTVSV